MAQPSTGGAIVVNFDELLRKFTGTEGEGVYGWICQYERLADLDGWAVGESRDERLERLPLFCENAGLTWVLAWLKQHPTEHPHRNWGNLCADLLTRFDGDAHSLRVQLFYRTQGRNESARDFELALRSLAARLSILGSEVTENDLFQYFRDGLKEEYVAQFPPIIFSDTLEEMVKKASRIEALSNEHRRKGGKQGNVAGIQSVQGQLQALQREFQDYKCVTEERIRRLEAIVAIPSPDCEPEQGGSAQPSNSRRHRRRGRR